MSETARVEHRLAPNDDPQFGGEYCICGSPMEWVDCWQCGGEGYRELYDDDPLWYDEDDIETCDICRGRGGYYVCWSVERSDR